jgi:hypothetical protein
LGRTNTSLKETGATKRARSVGVTAESSRATAVTPPEHALSFPAVSTAVTEIL